MRFEAAAVFRCCTSMGQVYRALAVRQRFVRPPQPSWEGLWRKLVLQLDTLDDGPRRNLGGAFGQRMCMI